VRTFGRPRARNALAGLGAAVLALALAGCGTASNTSSNSAAATVPGSVLDIVASLPPGDSGGQVARDVLDAEKLAYSRSRGKVGSFTLRLLIAHAGEISADARDAVADTQAIAYLGEIQPGTSGVSLQITNELGMLQVSPTDTAAYLTQRASGVPDAPGHFYPASGTYGRTFARMVPSSAAEASALVSRMQSQKLTGVAVEHDSSAYGVSLADALSADARHAGMTVTSAGSRSAGAAAGAASSADAIFYAGEPGPAATRALDAAASGHPHAKLFAPSALYDDAFVHGLSGPAQHALTVSAPGIPHGSLDTVGQAFVNDFARRYRHQPAPQAIFGYEAMRALIATLQKAGAHAAARTTIVDDFRSLSRSAAQSALGAYSLRGGDTSLRSFVFARVAHGALVVR
jgi:ABC-type branched-subunit amino acid transport system substrate-binding protein